MLLIESTHAAEMQRGLVKNIFATFCSQSKYLHMYLDAGLRTVRLCILRQIKKLYLFSGSPPGKRA
jgi:hypothetical protein